MTEISTVFRKVRKKFYIVGDREFDSFEVARKFFRDIEFYKDKHFFYLEYEAEFFDGSKKLPPSIVEFKKKQILMVDSILGLVAYLANRFPESYVKIKETKLPTIQLSNKIDVETYDDYLKLIRTPVSPWLKNKTPKLIKIDEFGGVKK